MCSANGNCITELVTEMPRSFSSAIQSLVAWRAALRDFTDPAIWIAPPNSRSFSVSVVLPASGWEMIAKVRRRRASLEVSVIVGKERRRGSAAEGAHCTESAVRARTDGPNCPLRSRNPYRSWTGIRPPIEAANGRARLGEDTLVLNRIPELPVQSRALLSLSINAAL